MSLIKKLTIFRAAMHELPATPWILIARSPWVTIRIVFAITGGLDTTIIPIATDVFDATVSQIRVGYATTDLAICIVGAVHHVRIVQQYTVIRDLPGRVFGDRCRESGASREGDESKSQNGRHFRYRSYW